MKIIDSSLLLNKELNVEDLIAIGCDPSTNLPIIIGTTQLMISEQNPERSVATDDDSSNKVRFKK